MEVFITYATNGLEGHPFVHFQMAEGVPDEPVLVRAIVLRNDIEFTVPDVGDFKEVVGADALVGTMRYVSGNEERVRLARKSSYWQ